MLALTAAGEPVETRQLLAEEAQADAAVLSIPTVHVGRVSAHASFVLGAGDRARIL